MNNSFLAFDIHSKGFGLTRAQIKHRWHIWYPKEFQQQQLLFAFDINMISIAYGDFGEVSLI